ncbi:MAG: hypothetical protein WBP61_10125 [Nocardioides sp.]
MIKNALVALVASAVVLAPASSATATETGEQARAKPGVTGTWKGGVYGDDGGPAGYPAKVKITKRGGKLHGKITYPGYCSGKWVYRGKKKGWFTFREVITRGEGTCVSPVSVKAKRVKKKLRVIWREPQTGDQGTMKAHRV